MALLKKILIVLALASPAWAGQAGNPPETPAKAISMPPSLPLGPIKNRPVIEGCTCEFQQPNARVKGSPDLIFISGADWEHAWIHVDQDVSLKKVSGPSQMPTQNGQKAKAEFTGPEMLKVDLDLETANMCPPSQPCDTIGYEGTMGVTRGAQKAVTRITGGCGC